MTTFDPEAALTDVLERKTRMTATYEDLCKNISSKTESALLLASIVLDSNILAEMKLREFIEAHRPVLLPRLLRRSRSP